MNPKESETPREFETIRKITEEFDKFWENPGESRWIRNNAKELRENRIESERNKRNSTQFAKIREVFLGIRENPGEFERTRENSKNMRKSNRIR